jgi:hypothetical protein
VTKRQETAHKRLQNAAVAFLKSMDWDVLVIGGSEVRQDLCEQFRHNYDLTVRFTGARKERKGEGAK